MRCMKRIGLSLLLSLAFTLSAFGASGMTDDDREHLLVHFQMTTQMVAEEVRGLSPAQLEYRASPDRWTIRECVSHLAVAEPDYWRDLMKAVKAPADMKDKKSPASDADIMWYGIDRVVHTKTGGGHEKVDTYKDMAVALAKFQALRATMMEYIKTTNDDFRATALARKSRSIPGNGCSKSPRTRKGTSSRFAKLRTIPTFPKLRIGRSKPEGGPFKPAFGLSGVGLRLEKFSFGSFTASHPFFTASLLQRRSHNLDWKTGFLNTARTLQYTDYV